LDGITARIRTALDAVRDKVNVVIDKVAAWVVNMAKKAGKIGKTADAKGAKPSDGELGPLPQATFPEDDMTHTVSFRKEGGKWVGVASSATVNINEFIAAAKKADGISDKAKDTYTPLAEKAAAKMATLEAELEAAPAKDKEAKRKALADAEVELAEALKKLLAGVDLKKFDEKYKLEGLVATYASTPRQTRDSLTPAHQPQASLL